MYTRDCFISSHPWRLTVGFGLGGVVRVDNGSAAVRNPFLDLLVLFLAAIPFPVRATSYRQNCLPLYSTYLNYLHTLPTQLLTLHLFYYYYYYYHLLFNPCPSQAAHLSLLLFLEFNRSTSNPQMIFPSTFLSAPIFIFFVPFSSYALCFANHTLPIYTPTSIPHQSG